MNLKYLDLNDPILALSVDIALDRLEAASIRFPALEDVTVNLSGALSNSKGFTDARRALILAKLCTFTFITKLDLRDNERRHRSCSGRG